MRGSTRCRRKSKSYSEIGLCAGVRGSTPRPYATNVAPAPHLSFSCVKKKDGGERKSLGGTIRRGKTHSPPRNNPCVAAGFDLPQGKYKLLALVSPLVRPLMPTRQQRSAFYRPRLAPASPHAPKSRATNSPGAPLHGENQETRVDALPLPVSSA